MISFIFKQVTAPDPQSYVQKTLSNVSSKILDEPASESQISLFSLGLSHFQEINIPIDEEADINSISDSGYAREKLACYIKELQQTIPLQAGEEDIEFKVSYLTADFNEKAANSVVVIRKTNLSEMYIFPAGWSFANATLLEAEQSTEDIEEEEVSRLQSNRGIESRGLFDQKAMAKSLANGIAGAIGGQIGSMVFGAIFPEGVPSYFDEVYKEIGKIVKKELHQNEVDKINAIINGLKNWIINTYNVNKASGKYSKEDLHTSLAEREANLVINLLGILQTEPYDIAGFQVFTIAVGVHIAILQELALVDPNVEDSAESPHKESIVKYISQYLPHGEKTLETIMKTRKDYVKMESNPQFITMGPDAKIKQAYSYRDNLTDVLSGRYFNHMNDDKKAVSGTIACEKAMNAHIANVQKKLRTDLGDPIGIMNIWKTLETNPLPKPS